MADFRVNDDGKNPVTSVTGRGKGKAVEGRLSQQSQGKKQEAIIKTKLLAATLKSPRAGQAAVTFAAGVKEYIEIDEVKRLRSYHERCQRIERVLMPFFGQKLLTEITVKDIEDWRRKRSNGRAVATVNVDHNLLKHMLKHAMRRDLAMRNVACLVAAPEPNNRRDRVLSADEWERLYNAAPGWFKPVLLTGYHTGMRLEEILSLTWDRVDLTKNRIYLPGHLTKTGKPREVPLTETLRNCLAELRERDGVSRIQGLVFERIDESSPTPTGRCSKSARNSGSRTSGSTTCDTVR